MNDEDFEHNESHRDHVWSYIWLPRLSLGSNFYCS